MKPGDRLLCALVENRPVGYQFKNWPLHVTIIPWFRLDMPSTNLAGQLKESLIGSQAFQIIAAGETRFGYKKSKEVTLVSAPELMRLEGQTRRFLHAHKAWVVDEADNTRRKYRPHVTSQKDSRLRDVALNCDRLYLIAQRGDYKEIEAEIIL